MPTPPRFSFFVQLLADRSVEIGRDVTLGGAKLRGENEDKRDGTYIVPFVHRLVDFINGLQVSTFSPVFLFSWKHDSLLWLLLWKYS